MSTGKIAFSWKKSFVNCTCKDTAPKRAFERKLEECEYSRRGVIFVDPYSGATYNHGPYLMAVAAEGFSHYSVDSATYVMNSALIGNLRKQGSACPYNVACEMMDAKKPMWLAHDLLPYKESMLAAALKLSCGTESDSGFSEFGKQFARVNYIALARWDRYAPEQRLAYIRRRLGTCMWDAELSDRFGGLSEGDRELCETVMRDVSKDIVVETLVGMDSVNIALLPLISNGLIMISRGDKNYSQITMTEMVEMEVARRFVRNEFALFTDNDEMKAVGEHVRKFPHIAYLIFMHMTTNLFNGMHAGAVPVRVSLLVPDADSPFYPLTDGGKREIAIKHREIAEYARSTIGAGEPVIKRLWADIGDPAMMLLHSGPDDRELHDKLCNLVRCFGNASMSAKVCAGYRRCIVDSYGADEPLLATWGFVDVFAWFMLQVLYETRLHCMRHSTCIGKHRDVIAQLTALQQEISAAALQTLMAEKTGKKKKKKAEREQPTEAPAPEEEHEVAESSEPCEKSESPDHSDDEFFEAASADVDRLVSEADELMVFHCGARFPFVPGAMPYKEVGLFKHQEFMWMPTRS